MMVRQSYTAVVERNQIWKDAFATEPYECGWASEAIFFVRLLEGGTELQGLPLYVQISPDGIRWCNEGTVTKLSGGEVDFVRVSHFGNWLRLAGNWPAGIAARVLVTMALKE
jgi:hypothetical protein